MVDRTPNGVHHLPLAAQSWGEVGQIHPHAAQDRTLSIEHSCSNQVLVVQQGFESLAHGRIVPAEQPRSEDERYSAGSKRGTLLFDFDRGIGFASRKSKGTFFDPGSAGAGSVNRGTRGFVETALSSPKQGPAIWIYEPVKRHDAFPWQPRGHRCSTWSKPLHCVWILLMFPVFHVVSTYGCKDLKYGCHLWQHPQERLVAMFCRSSRRRAG